MRKGEGGVAAGEEGIRFERHGRLGVVTLDRPKALNALTLGMVRALDRLDELVTVSQRRGIQFAKLLSMRANDPAGKGHLPMWHLSWPEGDLLFFKKPELAQFITNEVPSFGVQVGSRGSHVAVRIEKQLAPGHL